MMQSKKKQPFQVQVYLYRESKDGKPLFLMLKRRPDIGGFWQGITGSIEPGESSDSAALREIREETGMELRQVRKLQFEHTFLLEEKWRHKYDPGVTEIREFAFLGEASTDKVTICDEHTEFQWAPYEVALQMLVWPGNKSALEEAFRLIATVDGDRGDSSC